MFKMSGHWAVGSSTFSRSTSGEFYFFFCQLEGVETLIG
jgi:hypothetical protein